MEQMSRHISNQCDASRWSHMSLRILGFSFSLSLEWSNEFSWRKGILSEIRDCGRADRLSGSFRCHYEEIKTFTFPSRFFNNFNRAKRRFGCLHVSLFGLVLLRNIPCIWCATWMCLGKSSASLNLSSFLLDSSIVRVKRASNFSIHNSTYAQSPFSTLWLRVLVC